MQNDVLEYYDEVEPRSIPKQASTFDHRPIPMVPEVSLIMEKPCVSKKMEGTFSNSIPELRSSVTRTSPYGTGESYATWKEKQFPQPPMKTPNRYHHVLSSTHNTSDLKTSHGFNQSTKSCNSFSRDYSGRNHSLENESSIKYNISRRSGQIERPNKYILSHALSDNEIDHHVNNSYNYKSRSRSRDERTSPNERRSSDNQYIIETYDRQKPRIYRSSSCSNADTYTNRSIPVEHEYQSKHSRSLQPMHYTQEHSHHHSECCTPSHNNSNTETETVKNLLQVITSQNEQIKNLQKQVERLLKLHEQSLKERNRCTCQPNGFYQNTQLYDQSHNSNLPIAHNNVGKDDNRCFSDLKMQEEKSKPTILEQKVSIGVMTSFELKVQNNPSLAIDNETKQRNNHEKVLPSSGTSNIIKNLVNDTGEMIRKKPTFFNPHALENISEASESHMSSLRQSHLCSDTTRQSIEAQDSIEVQNTNFYKHNYQENEKPQINSESRKYMNTSDNKYDRQTPKLSRETREPMYERIDNNMQERVPYRYNLPYENLRSSPHENLRSSPHEKYRSSPHQNLRSSPHENLHSSPHENLHSSPHENLHSSPHENLRSSPHENLRSTPHENLRSTPHENLRSTPRENLQEKRRDEFHAEPLMTDIIKTKNTRCDNFIEECLSLSSSELDVEDPSPPSPEPSIHLDMQEYSSEGGSLPPQRTKVGWTIYNNVLDQVNQILQNTPIDNDPEQELEDGINNEKKEYDNNVIMDTVKAATLEQLTKLGISFSDNVDKREPNYNKKVVFDASYYARQVPETHLAATGASIETNTSMHMKALAMKYLNDEQLADMAVQKPRPGAMKQVPSNVQNTNMSFATMHYLQRYHLLPGTNSSPMREAPREDYRGPIISEKIAMKTVERREPSPHRYPPFAGTSKMNYPNKILDISTLKQQPKLL